MKNGMVVGHVCMYAISQPVDFFLSDGKLTQDYMMLQEYKIMGLKYILSKLYVTYFLPF